MSKLSIRQDEAGVRFKVKVVPGGSRNAVAGILGDMLKVKVAAAAEKGKANSALVELLAEELGLKRNAVRIISGSTNPVKEIRVEGVTAEQIMKLAEG